MALSIVVPVCNLSSQHAYYCGGAVVGTVVTARGAFHLSNNRFFIDRK